MNQDSIFKRCEGDNWFSRNREALERKVTVDWPSLFVERLESRALIRSVLELGCANGWRLERIKPLFSAGCRLSGIDASRAAVEDGRTRFPDLDLHEGLLSDVPVQGAFDLVIIYFVLHWVDRSTLARSISEIDRVVKDGGLLIVGDFLPDVPQRRKYHHLPDENVFTYKQDYTRIFENLCTYRELARVTFRHDAPGEGIGDAPSGSRAFCSVLRKSLQDYYPEAV